METKNSTYLILSIILLILSVIGGYFLFQKFKDANQSPYNSVSTPKIEMIPTDVLESQPTSIPTAVESSTSAKTSLTPTTTISSSKISPTRIPTPTKIASSTSSNSDLTVYSSTEDNFSVSYQSSRTIVKDNGDTVYDANGNSVSDTTIKINRYNFIDPNKKYIFAIHVAPSDFWCWVNTGRSFSETKLVANQPTFVHDIALQTIVDFKYNGKNYTIQCVHNGVVSVKEECQAFISSFKFL